MGRTHDEFCETCNVYWSQLTFDRCPGCGPSYRETPEAPPRRGDGRELALHLEWRVGRKVGRTVYAMISDDPTDHDLLIGMMDTRELAAEAVDAHNARVRPLPDWMPTPEELDAMVAPRGWTPAMLLIEGVPRLVRAVRWFLEDRENR